MEPLTFSQFFDAVIVLLTVLFVVNSGLSLLLIRRRNGFGILGRMGFAVNITGIVAYMVILFYRHAYSGGQPSEFASSIALAWVVFIAVYMMASLTILLRGKHV